jgi:hypothetical protein
MALAATRRPGRCGRDPFAWPQYPHRTTSPVMASFPRFRTPGRSRPLTDSTSPARAGRDYWTVADIHPHYKGPPAVQRHPAASLSVKERRKQLTHPIRYGAAAAFLRRLVRRT